MIFPEEQRSIALVAEDPRSLREQPSMNAGSPRISASGICRHRCFLSNSSADTIKSLSLEELVVASTRCLLAHRSPTTLSPHHLRQHPPEDRIARHSSIVASYQNLSYRHTCSQILMRDIPYTNLIDPFPILSLQHHAFRAFLLARYQARATPLLEGALSGYILVDQPMQPRTTKS
jgi:hypothetical protein